jgi:hypothetical protein
MKAESRSASLGKQEHVTFSSTGKKSSLATYAGAVISPETLRKFNLIEKAPG